MCIWCVYACVHISYVGGTEFDYDTLRTRAHVYIMYMSVAVYVFVHVQVYVCLYMYMMCFWQNLIMSKWIEGEIPYKGESIRKGNPLYMEIPFKGESLN